MLYVKKFCAGVWTAVWLLPAVVCVFFALLLSIFGAYCFFLAFAPYADEGPKVLEPLKRKALRQEFAGGSLSWTPATPPTLDSLTNGPRPFTQTQWTDKES